MSTKPLQRVYRGINIHENPAPRGYKARWWARVRGHQVVGWTIAEVKSAIRMALDAPVQGELERDV